MKRVCVKKEIQEKRLKIGKNLIKVRMVADCCKKVAATNGELDHEKHDTLGNTVEVEVEIPGRAIFPSYLQLLFNFIDHLTKS